MNRKAIYMCADMHLGHAKSIEFDRRPFRDVEHMNRVIVNNYNSVVPPEGLCYILGDVGFTDATKLKALIDQLNGTKVLILGNHDRGHNAMYACGFDVVLNSATLWIAGHEVTMSHCPLRGLFREDVTGMRGAVEGDNWHGESKHLDHSVQDHGQFHLHGHIHSGIANNKPKIQDKQFDVGLPANNYRPVSISVIESWIAKYE